MRRFLVLSVLSLAALAAAVPSAEAQTDAVAATS